jgi:predicted DNA-binding transcriptional regulator YafY
VPVISLPGKGYAISEGFFLPPLIFNQDEAAAIALGVRLLASQATGRHVGAAKQALTKIMAVLPDDVRRHVDRLNSMITMFQLSRRFDLDDPTLRILQEAILDRAVIRVAYRGRYDEDVTERDIEPLELTYFDRSWYLRAYCRLRQDLRTSRVSRMMGITHLNERFEPRLIDRQGRPSVEVVVRFAESAVSWEGTPGASNDSTRQDDGSGNPQ